MNGPWYGDAKDGRQRHRQNGRLQSQEERPARIHARMISEKCQERTTDGNVPWVDVGTAA